MNAREKKRVETVLLKELDMLKILFSAGQQLDFLYLPGADRTNDKGNRLLGEVQANTIILYESDEQKAIHTLQHEFIEHMIKQRTAGYVLVINMQKEIIETLLYGQDEALVETLVRGLSAQMQTS